MKKFQTMDELIVYMVGTNAPNELKNVAIESMQAVEEINPKRSNGIFIFPGRNVVLLAIKQAIVVDYKGFI